MSETFDPYRAWLGIPPEEQPPNYYRLLGVQPLEEDPEVIGAAADRRVGNLHAVQTGEHAELARGLLGEIAYAKACLLNPSRKAAYDKGLRESLAAREGITRASAEAEGARTERFLGVLQERDLLPADLLEGLRRQVTQSQEPVPAEAVAKRLIEAGHLTPALAERLLAAGSEGVSPPAAPPPKKPGDEPRPTPPQASDDDLQLVPVDDGPGGRVRRAAPKPALPEEKPGRELGPASPQASDDDLQLVPVDDGPGGRVRRAGVRPSPQQPAEPPIQKIAEKPPQPLAVAAPGSLVEEEFARPQAGDAGAAGVGPLDGLMADALAAGGPLMVAPRRTLWRRLFSPRRYPGRRANVWDSPLLLVGGGILLTLLLLLIGLVFALSRQTGDEALRLANEDYRNGSYSQAISKYNQYLQKFSNHSGVSLARVNCGLAQLRQATPKGTRDWSAALQVADEVLDEIATEREFKRAEGDLSAILLTIAQGLAAQAQQKPTAALVEQTKQALALMRKYVPPSLLRVKEIAEIEASLALTEHEIARGARLAEAIAAMKQQVAQGDMQRAYAIRKALLKDYPLLADNEQLSRALIEVSAAQQKAVQIVQKRQAAETGEPASPLLADVALTRRTSAAVVPGAAGRVVFAQAGGAAYGLDAASGKVLWRRFVGFDGNGARPSFPPTPISPKPGSDVLLVDAARNELLRVEAANGRLRWRHALGESLDAHPVIAAGEILVATRSKRLVRIDAADGSSSGYVQMPQGLRVAPAVDAGRQLIFQVADHSNLFVLAFADGRCRGVVYLGHELGGITAPPAVVGRFLLIAENDRARDSVLHVLAIEEGEKGLSLSRVQQVRLSGHVDVPPAVDAQRGRALVATDLGAVYLFELSGTDAKQPLRAVAEAAPAGDERLVRFSLLQADYVWIAGTGLTQYSIDLSRRRLAPKWTGDQAGAAQQPLAVIGGTIFHVRRKRGIPGVFVSAVATGEQPGGAQPLWETHLAVPLAGEPVVDPAAGTITAVSSVSGVYQVEAAGLKGQQVLDQPDVTLQGSQLRQPIGHVIPLEGGLLAMTVGEGSDQIAVFDPQAESKQLRWLKLPDVLACPPIAWAGGLLAPCRIGQVFLLDARSGNNQTEPFQPRLEGGVELPWRMPADARKYGAVLADGRTGLYRVQIEPQPKPHLEARDRHTLAEPIVSPVAVVGNVAYAVDAAGALAVFKLPGLSRIQQSGQPLGGRCVWGPRRVGGCVMLSTDDDRLLCLDGSGELRWRVQLPYGPLAGAPLEAGGQYILAALGGVVWRVEAKTGQELGKIDTGRPLGTGPVPLGEQLLLGGRDGSLLEIERP